MSCSRFKGVPLAVRTKYQHTRTDVQGFLSFQLESTFYASVTCFQRPGWQTADSSDPYLGHSGILGHYPNTRDGRAALSFSS